jgi:hypothetical protein
MTSQPVTLINVFEIAPENAEEFLVNWRERAEFMSKQPGFRSFSHAPRALDRVRFQLVNVAEWYSTDALHVAAVLEIALQLGSSQQLNSAVQFGFCGRRGRVEGVTELRRVA